MTPHRHNLSAHHGEEGHSSHLKTKALHQGKEHLFILQKRPPHCLPEAALLCQTSTTQKS